MERNVCVADSDILRSNAKIGAQRIVVAMATCLITSVSYFIAKVGPVKSKATQYYVTRACAYIVLFEEKCIGICFTFLLLLFVYSYCT